MHGDARDGSRHGATELDGALRRHLARRRSEHEAERIGPGLDGRFDRGGAVHPADLHEHRQRSAAARPVATSVASAARGSSARISDEPTSASLKPNRATVTTSSAVAMPLSATAGRCFGKYGASSANRANRTSRSRRSRQLTPARIGGAPCSAAASNGREPLEVRAVERLEQHEQAALARALDERADQRVVEHRDDHEDAARSRRARLEHLIRVRHEVLAHRGQAERREQLGRAREMRELALELGGLGQHRDGRGAAGRVRTQLRARVEAGRRETAGRGRAQLELGDHVEALQHERRRLRRALGAARELRVALGRARARTRSRLDVGHAREEAHRCRSLPNAVRSSSNRAAAPSSSAARARATARCASRSHAGHLERERGAEHERVAMRRRVAAGERGFQARGVRRRVAAAQLGGRAACEPQVERVAHRALDAARPHVEAEERPRGRRPRPSPPRRESRTRASIGMPASVSAMRLAAVSL